MEDNLQHEDLLIKLRAKLNEDKIKLWEQPYLQSDNTISQSLQELGAKYATDLALDQESVVGALRELQLHSQERSKANTEFQETGFATFRVRVMVGGQKPQVLTVRKKLDVLGSELVAAVASEANVAEARIKLIYNGKVIKPSLPLEGQGIKNGAQMMALAMSESPEEVRQEDNMYMEMRQTRDDATLLAECADMLDDDEVYIKLEDQSGNAIQLPRSEKNSLLVGLALHERGRAHIKKQEYAQALVLLLEADTTLSECRSSILETVDNYAVLQVDISWCYLWLAALRGAGDAARRLARAERTLLRTYTPGEPRAPQTLLANERVLFMRLYLLQGIVSYHQNRREEARRLLASAEAEINALRVDESAVSALMALGWSASAARGGLRAARGDVHAAHRYLRERRAARRLHRTSRRQEKGRCADGRPLQAGLVAALAGMGYSRRLAAAALRHANNSPADAVRAIQEHPDLFADVELSEEETDSLNSNESPVEPDDRLVAELAAMGYSVEDSRLALTRARNHISGAVDILVAGGGRLANEQENPSTSSGARPKQQKQVEDKEHLAREEALARLRDALRGEEDDYLDSSLQEEEEFLAQYKSLL